MEIENSFATSNMSRDVDRTSLSLLGLARSNDQEAWNQLVSLYGPLVEKWCRQAGLSADETADLFQETFKSVATKLHTFTPSKKIASFRSWLKTIVRNKTIDHFRSAQKRAIATGGTVAQQQIASVEDPLQEQDNEAQDASEDALIVRRAMDLIRSEFDPKNWRAFERVAIKGEKAADVARELNVNPQAIRQANYRIRRRLRIILKDLVPPEEE